jgi:3-oxoacyl-(acyl-carrier-protein) synthase
VNPEPLSITAARAIVPDSTDGGARRIRGFGATKLDPALVRRTSRLGRLAMWAVEEAFAGAGITVTPDLGLVVGTALGDLDETSGFLEGVHKRGATFGSPQHFQRSLHSAIAGELAILYGLTGYNVTVTQGLWTGEAALYQAALAVRSGRCSRCLCVAVDGVSNALLAALAKLGETLPAGEGAAAVLLEKHHAAPRLATLLDVSPVTPAPSPSLGAARDVGELGVHGALGLVRLVRAIEGRSFSSAPPGMRLDS